MESSLERVRNQIATLELQITNLRIAEREILALSSTPAARPSRTPQSKPAAEPEARKQIIRRKRRIIAPALARQSITSSVADILRANGSLPVAAIAKEIRRTRRNVSNRAVSFAVQELKRRGVAVKNGAQWVLIETTAATAQS